MRRRDALFRQYTVVQIFAELSDAALEGLQGAAADYVLHPASAAFRERLGNWARDDAAIVAAASESVVRLPAGLTNHELIIEARRRGVGVLPFRLVISGRTLALASWHAAMDGIQIGEFSVWLLTTAAGGAGVLDSRPIVRMPVLRALRNVGAGAIRRYSTRYDDEPHPHGPLIGTPGDTDAALMNATLASIWLPAPMISRIHHLRSAERSTWNTCATSLVIGALRRMYIGTADVPVCIPIDLRRYVGQGRVDGNFLAVDSFGSFLHGDWSSSAILARLTARIRSGAAMVSLLQRILGHAWESVGTALPRPAAGDAGRHSISISLLGGHTAIPEIAWYPGTPRHMLGATLGPWPPSTEVRIVTFGTSGYLSLWDVTGTFTALDFEQAVSVELAERERQIQTA